MSKRTRERDVASDFVDSELERALEDAGRRGQRMEQKTRQLCRQVQRALNLALASGQLARGGIDLDDVFVIDVLAAGGCGRLLVQVAVPVGRSASSVLAALRELAAALRAIVAGYISRKRAPELSFVAAPPEGDAHE